MYIVDDEASAREGLRFLLASVGLSSQGFDSPRSFLARYKPGSPGCLILDLRFPGMSGFDLLDHLRARGIEIPVLILSGYATVPLTVRAMRAKALGVIEKPYHGASVIEQVERALAIDRARQRKRAALLDAQKRIGCLTKREKQVAAGVVAGKLSKEIAADLKLSCKTVEAHRKQVMVKTRAKSVPELVRIWDRARKPRRK